MAQKRGPRLRGQRLLDNAPCQAAVSLDSGALPFPRHRALLVQHRPDRHANGSPFGGAGERSETERASPFPKSICTAISTGFCQSDAIAVLFYFSVASFPSQSPSVTALPKGEPFDAVRRSKKLPLSEELEVRFIRTRSFCHLQTHRRWRSGTLPAGRRPAGSSSPRRRRRR